MTMIVYKTWFSNKKKEKLKYENYEKAKYYYSGWFLFGIIPLFIRREFN
jgi:hypothetical protein